MPYHEHGSIVHNLVIEGQGVERVFRMTLEPGCSTICCVVTTTVN